MLSLYLFFLFFSLSQSNRPYPTHVLGMKWDLREFREGSVRVEIAEPNRTLSEPYRNPNRTLTEPYRNHKPTLGK